MKTFHKNKINKNSLQIKMSSIDAMKEFNDWVNEQKTKIDENVAAIDRIHAENAAANAAANTAATSTSSVNVAAIAVQVFDQLQNATRDRIHDANAAISFATFAATIAMPVNDNLAFHNWVDEQKKKMDRSVATLNRLMTGNGNGVQVIVAESIGQAMMSNATSDGPRSSNQSLQFYEDIPVVRVADEDDDIYEEMSTHPNHIYPKEIDATIASIKSSVEENVSSPEENVSLTDNERCVVCYVSKRDCVYDPCGHLVCCANCATKTMKCPVCRSNVEKAIKFFRN